MRLRITPDLVRDGLELASLAFGEDQGLVSEANASLVRYPAGAVGASAWRSHLSIVKVEPHTCSPGLPPDGP